MDHCMKQLESGQDKLQKIADDIRLKTLEPAKRERDQILEEANKEANRIVAAANSQAEEIKRQAKESIEQDRRVFHSNLIQASKQSLESLRQAVEKTFFSDDLQKLVEKSTIEPNLISDIIKTCLKAIEKEGIETELTALIPKTVSTEKVNALLGEEILKKLKEGGAVLGDFNGGAKVMMHENHITLDMTDKALQELLMNYCRKDFRSLLFANKT